MDTYTSEISTGAKMPDDPELESRFLQIFHSNHDRVYAYCRRRCEAETAREATAEVFLTAWRRFDDIPDGDRALPWLFGVARRVLANEFRRQKRYRNLVARTRSIARPNCDDVESVVVRKAEYQTVLDALTKLRPADQELLRLAVWEELSHGQIGEILGCSAHAVGQRITRASKRLASELRRAGHIPMKKTTSDPVMRGDAT